MFFVVERHLSAFLLPYIFENKKARSIPKIKKPLRKGEAKKAIASLNLTALSIIQR
jgi:hypothetical protein